MDTVEQRPRFETIELRRLHCGADTRDAEETIEDLVTSFGVVPQLQNIVVRPLPDSQDFVIISGHRRVRAARECGWTHIEAKIVDVDDTTAELLSLEENLRRKNLRCETKSIARLLELYEQLSPEGLQLHGGDRRSRAFQESREKDTGTDADPVSKLAQASGQSIRTIRRKAKIGRFGSEHLNEAVARGEIPLTTAEKLARQPASDQDKRIDELRRKERHNRPARRCTIAAADRSASLDEAAAALRYACGILNELETEVLTANEYETLHELLRTLAAALRRQLATQ